MHKDLKKIVEALIAQGFDVDETRRGHVRVYLDGIWVTTFAGTPSDYRSWRNSLAAAKRAGFHWPPP